jgi:hypothetical protein
MMPIETAILRTVLYADVFNFPMTVAEIQHFLISDVPTTCAQVERALQRSVTLQQYLTCSGGYVMLAERMDLIDERRQREQASDYLWPLAMSYGAWLGRLPFVRMVALTGALAMRNAATHTDDLDYLIVTAPHRVWLARACAILVVRLVKLRGIVICPNYVLAEDALEQDQKDLFIAHEIAQMIPVYGEALYQRFRSANRWADEEMPNAQDSFYSGPDEVRGGLWSALKRLAEWLLGGKLGDTLESWEYRRKLARFAAAARTPHSAARLDESRVKGHFNDYGHPVLRQYQQRLREYGLEETPLAAPGD